MARDRLEDLGRIHELLDRALLSPVFYPEGKDATDDVDELKATLTKCWSISSGQDFLNDERRL